MTKTPLFTVPPSGLPARLRATALLLALTVVAVTGCGDDGDDVPNDVSAVGGRVDGGAGSGAANGIAPVVIEGATVTLGRINASGNLETVSNAGVTSDAQGDFRVETDLDNVRYLVVVADKGSTHLEAVVADAVRHGVEVKSPPLTAETTAEARVWARIVADGDASTVSFADVATYMTASLAGSITGVSGSIQSLATALEAEADARTAALVNAEFGVTTAELAAINQARTAALVQFQENLLEADTQAEIDAAWDSYFTADAQAYISSDLSLDAVARTREIASRAFVNAMASANPTVGLAARKGAALARASILVRASLEAFTDAGANSTERGLVAAAGTTLMTSLRNAVSVSAIDTAFDNYHDTLLARLQAIYPTRAAAIVTADTGLYGVSGPRTTLQAAVATSTSANVLVPAYVTYFNTAETMLTTALTGATTTEINAITRVLLNASMIM